MSHYVKLRSLISSKGTLVKAQNASSKMRRLFCALLVLTCFLVLLALISNGGSLPTNFYQMSNQRLLQFRNFTLSKLPIVELLFTSATNDPSNSSADTSVEELMNVTAFYESQTTYFNIDLLKTLISQPVDLSQSPYCRARHELTIVTAYFNIGTFPKGSMQNKRHSDAYLNWLRGYAMLANPIVFLSDDPAVLKRFREWRNPNRSEYLCTRSILVNRTDFWPWQSVKNISMALKALPYAHSPPCTTTPEYDAAVNTKYPVIELVAALNPYRSRSLAWLDAGEYRHAANDNVSKLFIITMPPGLPAEQVAYLQIFGYSKATAKDYFLKHIDWIAGGSIFGTIDAMFKLSREYSRMAQLFMKRNLVGADQQVLGGMYGGTDNNQTGIGYPAVRLKLYEPRPSAFSDPWFHLAYLTRRKFEPAAPFQLLAKA